LIDTPLTVVAIISNERREVPVRTLRRTMILTLTLAAALPALAQTDGYPLKARVTSSGVETIPLVVRPEVVCPPGGCTETAIIVTLQIRDRVYRCKSPRLLDIGNYPAAIDKEGLWLQVRGEWGEHPKPKDFRLTVISISAATKQSPAPKQ
jgi:hypothetical protein